MDKIIFEKIKTLQKELKKEGFIIDGIIGSFVKEKQFKDIDLVYHLNSEFLERYKGFKAFNKIEEIKNYLEKNLNLPVDLIDRDYANKIMRKVIKRDLYEI